MYSYVYRWEGEKGWGKVYMALRSTGSLCLYNVCIQIHTHTVYVILVDAWMNTEFMVCAYNLMQTFMRRNSVYVGFIIAGAFVGEKVRMVLHVYDCLLTAWYGNVHA